MIVSAFARPFQKVFLGFFLMLFSSSLSAQVTTDPEVRKVFEYLYSYQLVKADSAVEEGLKRHPQLAEWSLLKATVVWWQIVSGNLDSEEWNDSFIDHLKRCERKVKAADKDDPQSTYNTILLHAMRTRFDLLKTNYLSAVNHLNASIDRISDSFEQEPEYPAFYLTSGLYYYFMEQAYAEYPLMRPYLFFYPDGDKEKGLEYLSRMTRSEDVFLRTEANYFLMRIYHDVDSNQVKAEEFVKRLLNEHPSNLMYRFYLIKIYWAQGENDKANAEVVKYKSMIDASSQLSEVQKLHMYAILTDDDS